MRSLCSAVDYIRLIHPFPTVIGTTVAWNLAGVIFQVKLVIIIELK